MFKKILLVIFVILASLSLPTISHAQASNTSKLFWDQTGVTLAEAQSFTYKVYIDGSTTGNVLTSTVCTGIVVSCSNNFPALTPGPHTLTLTASSNGVESNKSAVLSFTFVVVATVPTNLRIGG